MNGITRFLLKNAFAVVLVGFALSSVGAYYSFHLFSNLRTDIEELLPTDARSVLDLKEVRGRLESTNNLSVVMFSSHPEGSKRFVDDLAAEVKKLPSDVSSGVEYKINEELAFFNDRKSLFVQLSDLKRIKNYIRAKINYEVQLYNPLTIFQEVNTPEPRLDLRAIQKKYEGQADSYSRFPDAYYASTDEKIRVLLVNQPGQSSGIEGAKNLKKSVSDLVAKLDPKKYAPDLAVRYTGGVADMIEEHEALIEDLALSTVVVCFLVMVAMLIYFRSIIGTFALFASLFAGTLMTFGLGFFEVGYLNANSAFMGSIVIGNGINFGIILLARFMEERRKHKGTPRSIAIALEKTFSATIVAALAAGLSYGSLILTSFRGFRQFGIIGFTGMVFCWIAAYTLLPALLIVFYRMGLLRKAVKPHKGIVIHLVSSMVKRFPKWILFMTAGLTIFSLAGLPRIDASMIETDMGKLRNRHSAESGSVHWSTFVDQVFQRYLSPLVVLPKENKNVPLIAEAVREAKAAAGEKSFIVKVSTIADFVPSQQVEKIKTLNEISRMLPQKLLSRLSPQEQKQVKDLLSPKSFKRFTENDLPELVKSKFRERDGTLGKLVLVEPSLSPELSKSDNLIQFVHEVREAVDKVEPGAAVAGTLPVTSDMFESIVKDGPKATLFAFIAVFLLIVILFRDFMTVAQCSFALLMGVLWILGFILNFHEKINFLNFIALPITFGIGVDYGVNIFQRYRMEKQKGIIHALEQTGGAVLLASFTTVTGYGSLLIASNQAFVSFGKLAVLGEFSCVIAAVISLPALIWYLQQKKAKHERTLANPVRNENMV
ncbi:MAG: MMPL family transporter [Bdellovibrionales bacterium]|nr:MMPL family transporter [Oligoflexia bacterium]